MDQFNGALSIRSKSFQQQVQNVKQEWLGGNPHNLTPETLQNRLMHLYTNMREDGTLKRELYDGDQLIALTTKLTNLERKYEELKKEKVQPAQAVPDNDGSDSNKKKTPYTVKPWRLEYKGDEIEHNGVKNFWCKGDHWSGGQKHNGMYCTHDTAGHDAWRKAIDADKSKYGRVGSTNDADDSKKPSEGSETNTKTGRIGLSEKLQAALCTQVGLPSDMADQILREALADEADSGNY